MNRNARLISGGCIALALLAGAGCGGTDSNAPPPEPSIFEQQQSMMREALDLAKEAQNIQRQHMAHMEREMREARESDIQMADDVARMRDR